MIPKSFVPVLLVLLAQVVPVVEAQVAPAIPATPAAIKDWRPSYDWSLEIDGKINLEARFFVERLGHRMIILSPDVEAVALVDQVDQNVTSLETSAVTLSEDGESATLVENATQGREVSKFTLDTSNQPPRVIFYLGDRRLKITQKQPLEGETTPEDILKHSPLYRKGMETYTPMMTDIQTIKSYDGTVDIEVFFGTWCPHCKVLIPKFMKAIEMAANPNVRVKYVGVPRRFANWPPAMAKRVRSVPSFIFYENGSETHRITGDPEKGTIEHAIAEAVTR